MRPRILLYCQPLLGSGHLTRSLFLCKELVQAFDIDFVYGGSIPPTPLSSERFHLIQLQPLWLKNTDDLTAVADPEGKRTLEEVFALRKEALTKLSTRRYDIIMTEMYPFQKWEFGQEIQPMIKAAKDINPNCKLVCSFKGMQGPIPAGEEIETLKKLQDYDAILSHVDGTLMPFEEFFALTEAIKPKLYYTGFVSDPEEVPKGIIRKKQILVTFGAGAYGHVLPKAIAAIAPLFKEYTFIVIVGSKAPEELKKELAHSPPNVLVVNFIDASYKALCESALCITLAGSTLVDVVKTKTPALVYTDASQEHFYRSFKFAERQAIYPLRILDLAPTRFASVLQKALAAPYKPMPIDVSGAEKTLEILLKDILPPDR